MCAVRFKSTPARCPAGALPRIAAGLALALGGCVSLPAPAPAPAPAAEVECRRFFDHLDARIRRAGVRDAGAARVPGYPYLRADRLLASFADAAGDADAFSAWLQRLRALDLEARSAEVHNLGVRDAAELLQRSWHCGAQLAAAELATPPSRAALRARVRVPDDYALLPRALGLYPLAVPFLNRGIAAYHEQVRADFATPLAALDAPGTLIVWVPPAASVDAARMAGSVAAAPRDALGIPRFSGAQWQQLAEQFAPLWWIETGGDDDRPGLPQWQGHDRPGVDVARPVVHFVPGYTRLGAQVLPTLSYVIWFSQRPPQRTLDPYAGVLDGLIWRVVLDPQGRALSYDSIHPCGCYRQVFAAQPLQRRARSGFWQEPVLAPQAGVPAGALALRVQSQTHYLRRVVPAAAAHGERRSYVLRPYRELQRLPLPGGGSRSLFAPDGLVAGTERGERWWLWPTGVYEPGAMRQWGRHATSFVGRSHFDDARFLEQSFVVPAWARQR